MGGWMNDQIAVCFRMFFILSYFIDRYLSIIINHETEHFEIIQLVKCMDESCRRSIKFSFKEFCSSSIRCFVLKLIFFIVKDLSCSWILMGGVLENGIYNNALIDFVT